MLRTSLSVKKRGNYVLFFWGHEKCEISAFATRQNGMGPRYMHNMIGPQKSLWPCLETPDHTHLKLHDQFITLIDMKLHAQYQLFISFSF